MLKVYTVFLILFLSSNFLFAQKKDTSARKQDTLKAIVDTTAFQRIGFESLFTITSTGDKTNPFQFELNPKAVSFIQTYMEKQGPSLQKMKTWGKPYFNLYDQILLANGVPVQLKYLSVIESSLSSNIVSVAGAVGPWQIMPEEAIRLGLKLAPNDERMDYEKSTQAAATILRESFAEFGDWLLVVAAYNGGAGRVRQAIKKKNTKDFWELQYELPLETRNHVKKFIATQYVFESDGSNTTLTLAESNVKKKSTTALATSNYKSLLISGRFRANIIAKYLDMPLSELEALNPGMDKILATGKQYDFKLPESMVEKFEARKNEILQASIESLYQIDKH